VSKDSVDCNVADSSVDETAVDQGFVHKVPEYFSVELGGGPSPAGIGARREG